MSYGGTNNSDTIINYDTSCETSRKLVINSDDSSDNNPLIDGLSTNDFPIDNDKPTYPIKSKYDSNMYLLVVVTFVIAIIIGIISTFCIYIFVTQASNIKKVTLILDSMSESEIENTINNVKKSIEFIGSLNMTQNATKASIEEGTRFLSSLRVIDDMDRFLQNVFFLVNESCKLLNC